MLLLPGARLVFTVIIWCRMEKSKGESDAIVDFSDAVCYAERKVFSKEVSAVKKAMLLLNMVLAALVCWWNYQNLKPGGPDIQALCSAGTVALGLVNLVFALLRRRGRAFCVVMAAGLVLAFLGDRYVSVVFPLGAALFAAGHICYFGAYCCLRKLRWQDLLWGAVIFIGAAAFLLLYPKLWVLKGKLLCICLGYALIISFMTGKAVVLFAGRPSLHTGVIALGSVLFFVSDLMLVLHRFAFQSWAAVACLALYFPAQCLLAHSGFYAPDRISQC